MKSCQTDGKLGTTAEILDSICESDLDEIFGQARTHLRIAEGTRGIVLVAATFLFRGEAGSG